ncbi:hypothetical protein QCA50_008938 [Cerrena zonata]|uniref:Protein kinase domain-containing protein n=1 Tax=Cerrena zonata TaxID=2478898 RepID=A0AAW0G858_9APHY
MFKFLSDLSLMNLISGSDKPEHEVEPESDPEPIDILPFSAHIKTCLGSEALSLTHDLDASEFQSLLEVIQILLDDDGKWQLINEPATDSNKLKLFRSLIQLSEASQKFPKSLFVVATPSTMLPKRSGVQSEVYEARWKGKHVAMRSRSHQRLGKDGEGYNPSQLNFLVECLKWRQLRHPNVLQLFGVDTSTLHHAASLIQPWIENGDMRTYFKTHTPKPDVTQLISWMRDVAQGMDYLHKMGITHGDLRGDNILISDEGTAQITNVVLRSSHEDTSVAFPRRIGGPERYMAPEYLRSGKPTPATDRFAFGFVCIEILTGEVPFPTLSDHAAITLTLKGTLPARPGRMPERVWSLVNTCWNHNPGQRPTMQAALHELSLSDEK